MEQGVRGLAFDIHRGTTHDGPGMRTTAFLKGCPLHCAWCQNPESISAHALPVWDEKKCIGCGRCAAACPHRAISTGPQGLAVDRRKCRACFACAEECPSAAMKQTGVRYGVEELADELCKDRMFFDAFEGGVTISGGEPTMQPEFLLALLRELKARGVHTAVDTCGLCPPAVIEALIPLTDVFLYDIKLWDTKLHFRYTGTDNKRILENFMTLCRQARDNAAHHRIWVRTPLIPGATATKENIRAIGDFLMPVQKAVERWELCAFNTVCKDKYRQLGISWRYAEEPLMPQAEVDALAEAAREKVNPEKVIVSGLTAK